MTEGFVEQSLALPGSAEIFFVTLGGVGRGRGQNPNILRNNFLLEF